MSKQSSSNDSEREKQSILKRFLNEKQDPVVVEKVYNKVSEILTKEENIMYIAVQKKPVVTIAPDCVVLTNRRFIIYRPRMLGRVSFEDHIWRDLHDAKLEEKIMGGTLTMVTVNGKKVAIDHLPKAQARRLYSFAQEMEENAREERRVRIMEEKRAAAGGVTIQGQVPLAQAQVPNAQSEVESNDNPVEKLKKLKEMLDLGLITQDDFDTKKSDLLSGM